VTRLEIEPRLDGRLRFVRIGEDILVGGKNESHGTILQRLKPGELYETVSRLKQGKQEGDMGDLVSEDGITIRIGGMSGTFDFPNLLGGIRESEKRRQKTREILAGKCSENIFDY